MPRRPCDHDPFLREDGPYRAQQGYDVAQLSEPTFPLLARAACSGEKIKEAHGEKPYAAYADRK